MNKELIKAGDVVIVIRGVTCGKEFKVDDVIDGWVYPASPWVDLPDGTKYFLPGVTAYNERDLRKV